MSNILKNNCCGFWLSFLAFAVSMVMADTSNAQLLPKQKELPRRFIVNFRLLDQIVGLLRVDTRVAIVRFTTDWQAGSVFPSTSVLMDDRDDSIYLNVRGRFVLIKALQNAAPPAGRIDAKIRLENLRRLSPKEKKLAPFFSVSREPMQFLVFMPKHAKTIMASTFIGPLPTPEIKDLIEVGNLLEKCPYPRISQKDARNLISSSNPWIIYIGLGRLRDLKKISSSDFCKAIESIPTTNSDAVIDDMFLTAWRDKKHPREILTKHLSGFFAKTKPNKQHRILTAVNKKLRQESYQHLVNLPALQNAARKYRRQIENDPARREVLREIDALLKIRGKVIAL